MDVVFFTLVRSLGSRNDTTEGMMLEFVWGSTIHVISPTLFDGACTQITLFVVPRSIPAVVARPRKPLWAIMTQIRTPTPINDGSKADRPPLGALPWCFSSEADFFLGLRVVVVAVGSTIMVYAPTRSRFRLRWRTHCSLVGFILASSVKHIQQRFLQYTGEFKMSGCNVQLLVFSFYIVPSCSVCQVEQGRSVI